ncbi:hypothetical protein PIIN_05983 [Serendipita indica DSM 11827]|uniref:Uncharacterized protein n=1 Tax=Serendipita indica (strain DSM 11827) TaxID=1109443 RepID=G4TL50_SERID|nr:hypothetical protein PIIN_05983 [Serendipita indica DSM 11827]
MATSSVDSKTLVLSMKQLSSSSEPWEAELRHYMRSICSSPCAVTMEAAVCFQVEKHKVAMIGRALKVINQPISSSSALSSSSSSASSYLAESSFDTPLLCASEEGVMNLSRNQRRYLLRSAEQSMRKAESALAYVRKASKEQVTPAGPSRVDTSKRARGGVRHDPHFYGLLERWYLQTAEAGADFAIAKWTDPVVHALLEPSETESLQSPITPTTITATTPIVCHRKEPDPQTIHEYELARSTMRSPPIFSDEESGSDKAASGDEFATDDEHDISF